jgi:hypothetical protein
MVRNRHVDTVLHFAIESAKDIAITFPGLCRWWKFFLHVTVDLFGGGIGLSEHFLIQTAIAYVGGHSTPLISHSTAHLVIFVDCLFGKQLHRSTILYP